MFPHRHPHTIHWIVVSLVLFLSSLTSSQSTATVTSSSGVSSVTQSSWTESSLKEDTQTTARIAAVNDTTFGTAGGTAPQSDTTATTTTHNLVTATTPIPLAATLGLIMPNPWQTLYTGTCFGSCQITFPLRRLLWLDNRAELNYTFGFVDAVPRPAPTYGGWMREVVPLIIMSNYTVDVLPSSGSEDPTSVEAIPVGSTGLCG